MLTILLIFSIGLWTASKSIFYHAHVMPDGEIVYHAHPYNKNSDSAPFKHHKHTDAQLAAIDNFGLVFFFILATISIVVLEKAIKYYIKNISVQNRYSYGIKGRSPPSFLFVV